MQTDPAEPDWDLPLTLSLTPAQIIHSLFDTAFALHTGTSSCVDPEAILVESYATDAGSGNYVRLVEQEFNDDGDDWHDWTVEILIGEVLVTAHWQVMVGAHLMEYEWNAKQAEQAFDKACVLVGKRLRRGFGIEDAPLPEGPAAGSRAH